MTIKQYIKEKYDYLEEAKKCPYCNEDMIKRLYGWICLHCLEPDYNEEEG